jgi:tRNA1(Val) A37 N6-methylase TrmN6
MAQDNIIHILNKRLCLHQPEGGFRTSLDSVMLAAACPAKAGESILDLGCGVGGAGLSVLLRVEDAKLTGVDVQESHIALAQGNAALNEMDGRADFVCADIRDAALGAHNHVICNPPYLESGTHISSPNRQKAMAMGHQDDDIDIKDWVGCAFDHIKGQGSLTMIHRSGQVDRIIQALGKRFGRTEIIPLWPRENVPAKRVIIRCWKHKKTESVMHPGLTLHQENGEYTPEAQSILRDAQGLF